MSCLCEPYDLHGSGVDTRKSRYCTLQPCPALACLACTKTCVGCSPFMEIPCNTDCSKGLIFPIALKNCNEKTGYLEKKKKKDQTYFKIKQLYLAFRRVGQGNELPRALWNAGALFHCRSETENEIHWPDPSLRAVPPAGPGHSELP